MCSTDSDQTARLCRLIGDFVGHLCYEAPFKMSQLIKLTLPTEVLGKEVLFKGDL